MSNPSNLPEFKVEIVSAPAVKDMTVSQVGQNMFSINLNVVAIVRYPSNAAVEKARSVRGVGTWLRVIGRWAGGQGRPPQGGFGSARSSVAGGSEIGGM